MDTDNFKSLIDRYILGTLSERDKAALRKLLDDPRYVRELERIMDRQLETSEVTARDYPEVANRIKMALGEKIRQEQPVHRISFFRRNWRGLAAAAAILLVLGSTVLTSVLRDRNAARITAPQSLAAVRPGSTKAVLTLADGSTLALDSAGNRVIQQGIATVHQNGGALEYAVTGGQGATSYNILSTPAGGQYQLTLPDGSRIWLNAASSLRFPIAFSGSERIVELKGEAYFEIAKNMNMPFKVKVNDMEVAVLGTHFNIMAYADESNVTTTLLEGAVKVMNSNREVLLKVGQQVLFDHRTKDLKVTAGDMEGAVAWKNSYFKFTNESIQSVMRKIARWYDVEIEYQGSINQKALWGTISRFEHISEVLQMLELTGSMQFRMEGRKVIVSQK